MKARVGAPPPLSHPGVSAPNRPDPLPDAIHPICATVPFLAALALSPWAPSRRETRQRPAAGQEAAPRRPHRPAPPLRLTACHQPRSGKSARQWRAHPRAWSGPNSASDLPRCLRTGVGHCSCPIPQTLPLPLSRDLQILCRANVFPHQANWRFDYPARPSSCIYRSLMHIFRPKRLRDIMKNRESFQTHITSPTAAR